jgi:hypothetical protein
MGLFGFMGMQLRLAALIEGGLLRLVVIPVLGRGAGCVWAS